MAESFPSSPGSGGGSFPPGHEPRDGAPTRDADALLFRRYRAIRELGRGGMGVVLLAHDTALEIPVAVKLVPDLVVKDTEAIADLRKEVLRGMALNHDGIVRTHNFERDASGAGIVMEFVEGETLADLKTAQPGKCFDPEQIIDWLGQLCAVLDYAHREAHIVHRDLKPRNIMVTRTGRVKVADFGISAMLSDSMSRHSMEGKISGTLSYMSPQQAEGKRPSHLDDVHALGATIYDLLTGKPPFFRGNPASIHAQIINTIPPSMEERREDLEIAGRPPLPLHWEETIAACLAKDPAQRPQSAGEIVARLRSAGSAPGRSPAASRGGAPPAIVPGPTVEPRETSAPAIEMPTLRGGEPARRSLPTRLWGGVLTAVVFIAGGAYYLGHREPGAGPKLPARSIPIAAAPSPIPNATPLPAPVSAAAAAVQTTPIASSASPQPTPPAMEPPASSPQRRAAELIQEGKQLRDRADLAGALVKLREALALAPQNAEAMAELAVTYEKMGLADKAAEQWKRVFDMGDAAGLYYTLAEAKLRAATAAALTARQPEQSTSPGSSQPAPSPLPPPMPNPSLPLTTPAPSPDKAITKKPSAGLPRPAVSRKAAAGTEKPSGGGGGAVRQAIEKQYRNGLISRDQYLNAIKNL